jgi:SMI1-KNR4 cell-wall
MKLIEKAIIALKENSISEPRICLPPSAEMLSSAEEKLRCKFPPSFLTFLEKAGSYQLPFWETYWVGPCEREDIVEANQFERDESSSSLPSYLVSFYNNGMGDQLCFDTRESDHNGEYPIVFWNHELSQKENLSGLEVVADDFAEWLMKEVEAAS